MFLDALMASRVLITVSRISAVPWLISWTPGTIPSGSAARPRRAADPRDDEDAADDRPDDRPDRRLTPPRLRSGNGSLQRRLRSGNGRSPDRFRSRNGSPTPARSESAAQPRRTINCSCKPAHGPVMGSGPPSGAKPCFA